MYFLSKRLEVAGAHKLELDYDSPCKKTHGHNWIITVHCMAPELNHNGMLIDFKKIKNEVMKFDHKFINDLIDFNPTAENLAKHICAMISCCYKVEVQESEGNIAVYKDNKYKHKMLAMELEG